MPTVLTLIPYAIALIEFGGGVAHAIGLQAVRDSYERWGFPKGFHLVTAVLELAAAGLILYPPLRLVGMGLAFLILVAALATLLRAREYGHSPAPVIFMALIALWFAGPAA